jgi:hypothetical protein
MQEYTFYKITENEFEKLIPLMQNCFGMDVNVEYFRWKFLDNPAGSFIGFVAEHKSTGMISAYYGVIPEKYNLIDKECVLYQSCDTMTHSEHRRKGLFNKLARVCYEYLEKNEELNVFGFGGENSTPGFIKMGWEIHSHFKILFIPYFLCLSNKKINLNHSEKLNSNLISFISKQKCESKKTLDIKFLNWKFNNPLFNYHFVWHEENERINSLLIYKIENKKIIIIEIIGECNLIILIKYAKTIVKKKKLKGILFYIDDRMIYKYLKLGFVFNPFKFGPFSTKIPFITLMKNKNVNWTPSMIEHDAI